MGEFNTHTSGSEYINLLREIAVNGGQNLDNLQTVSKDEVINLLFAIAKNGLGAPTAGLGPFGDKFDKIKIGFATIKPKNVNIYNDLDKYWEFEQDSALFYTDVFADTEDIRLVRPNVKQCLYFSAVPLNRFGLRRPYLSKHTSDFDFDYIRIYSTTFNKICKLDWDDYNYTFVSSDNNVVVFNNGLEYTVEIGAGGTNGFVNNEDYYGGSGLIIQPNLGSLSVGYGSSLYITNETKDSFTIQLLNDKGTTNSPQSGDQIVIYNTADYVHANPINNTGSIQNNIFDNLTGIQVLGIYEDLIG